MTLQRIKRQLESLRDHPEPDETVFEYAAALLRDAFEIALAHGIEFKPVGGMTSPAKALLEVNRLIIASEPERFLLIREAAQTLSVSQDKIAEWVKAGRLEAVNVANPGKRPQYRIPKDALRNLKTEKAYRPKHL